MEAHMNLRLLVKALLLPAIVAGVPALAAPSLHAATVEGRRPRHHRHREHRRERRDERRDADHHEGERPHEL
jgi:hypothetical protein